MKRIYEARAYTDEPIAKAYWPETVETPPADPAARGALSSDIVVLGGGFTGLNAALEMAKSGAEVMLIEARQIGWGASGRNGGFCGEGGTKLSNAEIKRKFGTEDLHRYANTQRAAIDHVAELLDNHEIDADRHSDGETYLAHRAKDARDFPQMVDEIRSVFGLDATIFEKEQLREHGLYSPQFHGALTNPMGFALNPMKYVLGLANRARLAGVTIFGDSLVTGARPNNGGWLLETATARIQAKKLVIATNGYSSDNLPDWLSARYLPVLSNVLVSRVLTKSEQRDQGFWSNQMCCDTRHLLHYFRLMPNGRMLFGMRGAIKATATEHERTKSIIRSNFEKMFPNWAHVETPYFWNGLICVSRNRVPFVGPLNSVPNAFAAMCYHGNGVSIGSYAGKLIADDVLGRPSTTPRAHFLSMTPKKFELGRFRRALLPLVYRGYSLLDAG